MIEIFEALKKFNYWDNQPENLGFIRNQYLGTLKKHCNNPLIKVLIGQRRCGKSYILRQFIRHLLSEGVSAENIFYFNKEQIEFISVNEATQLNELLNIYQKRIKPKGKIFILLDEIQEISNWEKLIISLANDKSNSYELYITGSNSHMLSSELSTFLTGRYIEIPIFPFSFLEYCQHLNKEESNKTLLGYLTSGGLPELFKLENKETQFHYVSALKDSIILTDIVKKYAIKDAVLLENLFIFLLNNTGSLFSVNSITGYLKSKKAKISHETVQNYLSYLCKALLVHSCERFDVKGKDILSGTKKYYINDLAFKNYLTSGFDPGHTRLLENCVYLYFLQKGYKVYVGTILGLEVDFVIERDGQREYYQVCYSLADENVSEREFRSLKKITDNYPKFVVSMDDDTYGEIDGIKHIPVRDLLLR